jgi:RNA-directed DNA polymerase
MAANYVQVPFERYADDVIVHCRTEREAKEVRTAIAERLRDCGLELHPEKTKIVYCKDGLRKGKHTNEKFDFLGYEFRPRRSKNRNGKVFLNFSPAISTAAAKAIRDTIRSWKIRELVLWANRKYKKLRAHVRRARHWIASISRRCSELFAHWELARSVAP